MGSSGVLAFAPCSVITALWRNGAACVPTSRRPPRTKIYVAFRKISLASSNRRPPSTMMRRRRGGETSSSTVCPGGITATYPVGGGASPPQVVDADQRSRYSKEALAPSAA